MDDFMYWCEKHETYHVTKIPKSEWTIDALRRFENACQ